jgi:GAF domain-containing protein
MAAALAALGSERHRLVEELHEVRDQLSERERYRQDLERRLQVAEQEQQRSAEGYGEVERQNANLANLYVASYRLHSTLDRPEVLLAIEEIVINLIGCEEMGIFELEEEGAFLRLVGSFGIDPAKYQRIPMGSGIIGRSAASGQLFISSDEAAERSPSESTLTACIPLTLAGRVTGAIALFRLLSHKAELLDVDREIFDLLATQAGAALYCSRLQAERLSAAGTR